MEKNGVWRTIKGRHIFIEDGQSLSDALKKNGLQTKKKSKEEDEYELYKRAYENPDSIDPMTENSTDWEELEKKYKDKYFKEVGGETPDRYSVKDNQISRISPYDETEYAFAQAQNDGSWNVYYKEGGKQKHIQEANKQDAFNRTRDINRHIRSGETVTSYEGIHKTYPPTEDYISIGSKLSRTPGYENEDWYFGKEAYTKHGDTLGREYAGKTISKRIADGNNENGLSTVAKQIGAKDEYEVVEALEGMVRNGKAQEIDDSTYKIIGTEINDLKPEAINDIKLDNINETKLEPRYGTLVRNGTQYNVTDHIDEHSYKGIGAAGHSFVGIEKEKYKIENPNDKSDWGWVYKEEYDKLTAKSKLKSLNDLIQSYMARGYSKETAKKLARNDMNKRKK